MPRRETNPHFTVPQHQFHPHFRPHRTPVVAETPPDQPTHSGPWMSPPPQNHDSQSQTGPLLSPAPRQPPQRYDQQTQQPPRPKEPQAKKPKHDDPRHPPLGPLAMLPAHNKDQPTSSAIGPRGHQPRPQAHSTFPQVTPTPPHHHHPKPHGLFPSPRRTKLLTWFFAGFCAIFWIVIILGGLIVLIIYLLFRPHNPRFDVSNVSLNAAYLDMGLLLNADITVLANFTNPNRKVRVDFSTVVLDLYYGKTLIASQYVEPFSAERAQSRFASVHMVTSQVRIPVAEGQRLKKEIERNAVTFQIKGVFRARSNLGSFLRYSYWLYGNCNIMVTGPPNGVTRGIRCRTKR